MLTWRDIVYRTGITFIVLFGLYALFFFYAALLGVTDYGRLSEAERMLLEQHVRTAVTTTAVAAMCYAVTRAVLYLMAWFAGERSD
jgi:hypothetical protein